MPRLLTASGLLTTETEPLASGGEGSIYRLHPSNPRQSSIVVKVYRSEEVAESRRRKLEYLVKNQPSGIFFRNPKDGRESPLLSWPLELVFTPARQFVGVTMPRVEGAIQLQELCSTSNPVAKRHGDQWQRFMHHEPNAPRLRIALARNLAAAVHALHSKRLYTLVDLKPANVLVQPDGLVTLVDVDSAQVLENGRLLFACPVTTPEYTPVEGQGQRIGVSGRPAAQTWDLFSYAVIAYELILGIHPFAGPCRDPLSGRDLTLPAEKIARGLFPNGRNRHAFDAVAPPHQRFVTLPPQMQALFRRCFDEGHSDPSRRPNARQWIEVLAQAGSNAGILHAGAAVPRARAGGVSVSPRQRRKKPRGSSTIATSASAPVGVSQTSASLLAPQYTNVILPAPSGGGISQIAAAQVRPHSSISPAASSTRQVFGWALAIVAGLIWLTSRGSVSSVPTAAPPSVVAPLLSPPNVPGRVTSSSSSPDQTTSRSAEASTDANARSTSSSQALPVCGGSVICLYERPSVSSPYRVMRRETPVVDWKSAPSGFYEITFGDARSGFVRQEQLSLFTKLPIRSPVRVDIP